MYEDPASTSARQRIVATDVLLEIQTLVGATAPLARPQFAYVGLDATDGLVYTADNGVTWNTMGGGPSGPTGASGPAGATGAAGPTGAAGAVGASGPVGASGAVGATGAVGPSGAVGVTGPQGLQGTAGTPGSVGATGVRGVDGDAGVAGPSGATGPTGASGPTGAVGAVGIVGPSGATGATGAIGPSGPAGEDGPTGADGPSGVAGATGVAGTNGASGPVGPGGGHVAVVDAITGNDTNGAIDGLPYATISAAVAAVSLASGGDATGYAVYVCSGAYTEADGSMTLPANMAFVGMGPTSTVVAVTPNATAPLIATVSGGVVADMTLALTTGSSATSAFGIKVPSGVSPVALRNVHVLLSNTAVGSSATCPAVGIDVDSGNLTMVDCEIGVDGDGSGDKAGISVHGSSGVTRIHGGRVLVTAPNGVVDGVVYAGITTTDTVAGASIFVGGGAFVSGATVDAYAAQGSPSALTLAPDTVLEHSTTGGNAVTIAPSPQRQLYSLSLSSGFGAATTLLPLGTRVAYTPATDGATVYVYNPTAQLLQNLMITCAATDVGADNTLTLTVVTTDAISSSTTTTDTALTVSVASESTTTTVDDKHAVTVPANVYYGIRAVGTGDVGLTQFLVSLDTW